MTFFIKAAGESGSMVWLAPRSDIGVYTLGPRRVAVSFPTEADAQAALIEVNESLAQFGFAFSIEAADSSPTVI
jgi:hypothetical protein